MCRGGCKKTRQIAVVLKLKNIMEQPPSVDEVVACIATLYHDPNPEKKMELISGCKFCKIQFLHGG